MKYYKLTFFTLSLITLFLLVCPVMAQTNNLLDSSFVPSLENFTGAVNAVAKQPDGKILVGGYFLSANGRERFGLARFNADGTLDESFNSLIGVFPTGVRAITVQPDGKILVGGFFSASDSQSNLIRLNANGSRDSTFTGTTNSTVYAIAIQPDGKILIGGAFTTVNFTTRFGSARLNNNGTLDTTFTLAVRTVFSIAVQPDGNILLGGNFTLTSPNAVNRIVRVSNTGVIDTAFSAVASANNTVRAIKIQLDGKIVLGGSFTTLNGNFRNALARLNADGTLDGVFNPSVGGSSTVSIESLDLDASGKILLGGTFSSINGSSRGNIGKLNSDGTLDTSFSPATGANLTVRAVIAETSGSHLIGGDFLIFDGIVKFRLARLNANGSPDAMFNAAVNYEGTVNDVEIQPDGRILVAGVFFYVNGIGYGSIARFNADGTLDTSFANFAQSLFYGDVVEDIEIQPDGKILVGGNLILGNSPTNYGVVRLNSNGTVDSAFSPVSITSDLPTVLKTLPNGQILVGGRFSELNGVPRGGIARLNSNGSLDTSFAPSMSSFSAISDIAVKKDGKIIIGGSFATIDGVTRNNLAKLNSNGTLDASFSADASNSVTVIKMLADESLLVGGGFSTIGGVQRNRIAKLMPNGQIDTSFIPDFNLGMPSADIEIYSDGRVIVAGIATPGHLVILNTDGSTNAVFTNNQWFNGNSSNNGFISDVEVQTNGKVVVGGSFKKVGNITRTGLARLNSINLPKKGFVDFDGDGKTDVSIFRPAAGEWWYLRSSDNGSGALQFGSSSDKLTPADFTGDGKTDLAFFRPSNGFWFILRSEDNSFLSFPFGTNGDVALTGDFDADGKADPTIFRPSTNEWFVLKSTGGTIITTFGISGDKPVIGDYDGDGKSDIAIYRPAPGEWWISRSSTNTVYAFQFGLSTDKPVVGDYTGDGKMDVAFWRPEDGFWYILRSEDSSFYSVPFGTSGDAPSPGDYDGDGRFDTAVFRPSTNTWFINRSTAGTLITTFGTGGDQSVPNSFVP